MGEKEWAEFGCDDGSGTSGKREWWGVTCLQAEEELVSVCVSCDQRATSLCRFDPSTYDQEGNVFTLTGRRSHLGIRTIPYPSKRDEIIPLPNGSHPSRLQSHPLRFGSSRKSLHLSILLSGAIGSSSKHFLQYQWNQKSHIKIPNQPRRSFEFHHS